MENPKQKSWHTFLTTVVACVAVVTFLQKPVEKRQDQIDKKTDELKAQVDAAEKAQLSLRDTLTGRIDSVNQRLSDSREVLTRIDTQVADVRRQLDVVIRQTKMSTVAPEPSPLSRGYAASNSTP